MINQISKEISIDISSYFNQEFKLEAYIDLDTKPLCNIIDPLSSIFEVKICDRTSFSLVASNSKISLSFVTDPANTWI